MQNRLFRKSLVIGIIILFFGTVFSSSISSNINKLAINSSTNLSQGLSEEEIIEQEYWNIPIRYKYLSEDGKIHTKTLSRSELMAERFQYHEKEKPSFISTDINDGNHPPIYIDGNNDFTVENGVTGGSGTENDPYIIEDWVIVNNDSAEHGIFITNTDVYFIIRNCTISGFKGKSYSGIYFLNVDNGKIEDSDLYKNYWGIAVVSSSHIEISNCTTHNNSGYYGHGISLWRSSNIWIISCESYNNSGIFADGIGLVDTKYTLIEGTRCYNNDGYGIDIVTGPYRNRSKYTTVKDCKIYNNQWGGIQIIAVNYTHRGYNNVIDCEIYNNGHHPYYDCAFEGIKIFKVNNNIVENCIIHHNGVGLDIGSDNNVIRNCRIYNHWMYGGWMGAGIMIYGIPIMMILTGNIIKNCDIYNQEVGISLTECRSTNVLKNNIYNNSCFGIMIGSLPPTIDTGRINKNNIYGNGWEEHWGRGLWVLIALFDARCNWWGSADGPSYHGPGNGDKLELIWSFLLIRPWASEPYDI